MNSASMSAGAVPTIKCEDTSPGGTGAGEGGGYLSVNVNLSAAVTNLLAAESAASTPRTPEILNSLIAMTSPLEQYNYSEKNVFKGACNNDSNSSLSNGSSATSPASGTPPSIQKTCSDLIKAGLKLSIESKRKMSGSDSETCLKRPKKEESDDEYDSGQTMGAKLTPEDEERRRRRRERNKIAATKCRMKKRERTVNLVTESEVLESQNIDLKSQLKDLEVQRRQLIDMLSVHTASCVKNNNTPITQTYSMQLRPYESPTPYQNYDAGSPYIRPESANVLASSYTCITPLSGESSIDTIASLDTTYLTPQIIEPEYHRPDSVMSLPPANEPTYNTDGFIPKTNLLAIEQNDQEYYEQDVNFALSGAQQCLNYPAVPDAQAKMNHDGCLV